ncbi:Uncharacterized protein TCM_031562 [Theobroma cacao]|uniref:Uncharacterized protein n=1 Tax=Theobroma cacao TaxID=3641 RepID=A0A061F8K7_THECC|nr:Uncharacterized protein TCM_031562 [Theobroma cacao]
MVDSFMFGFEVLKRQFSIQEYVQIPISSISKKKNYEFSNFKYQIKNLSIYNFKYKYVTKHLQGCSTLGTK